MNKNNTTAQTSFSHLSLRDLVEARDLFHAHLINKKNVVATAVGRYLIRQSELDSTGRPVTSKKSEPRTLHNSIVLDISWPCILVFVDKWESPQNLVSYNASDIVPKTIYMPDGRVVPVCVVQVDKSHVSDSSVNFEGLNFPANLTGGGFPVLIESQGQNNVASVGCVVSDGNKYYALTAKHAVGDGRQEVRTVLGGNPEVIGRGSKKTLGKVRFSDLYPGWQNNNVLVNCDAGLIEIDDVKSWKTDIYNIGEFDEMFDLNTFNLNLSLIAEHSVVNGKRMPSETGNVKAWGAVSGNLEGEILCLFYRYKSVGGTEYVSDFLIAGKNGADLQVHHGDSGTVWVWETKDSAGKPKYNPIALNWGQHEFFNGTGRNAYSFSLSTSLSNVCRSLDVDLVRGWNIDNDYSWGKTGHYKIAAQACDLVITPKLSKLLLANKNNISYTDKAILNGDMKNAKWAQFVPMADVPDIIWRMNRKADEANHFADMDEANADNETLLDLCLDQSFVDIDKWNEYYTAMEAADSTRSSDKRGALPFRVWQAYNLMVKYLKAGKVAEFIMVGGTVSHYLGDACQPLHVSYLHHGHPGADPDESKVHSIYETNMMDRYQAELFTALNKVKKPKSYKTYTGGKNAALAVIDLMRKVITDILSPEEIISMFNSTSGRGQIAGMWDQLGDRTIACVTEGSKNLALFWESAWAEGEGDKLKLSELKAIDPDVLTKLYMNSTIFRSVKLKDAAKYKSALNEDPA